MDDLERLLKHVSDDRRKAFLAYVNKCIKRDSYAFDHEFLGFMDDYENYNQLLLRKVETRESLAHFNPRHQKRLVVYDVGCALALQHLLFDPRIDYVGIDVGGAEPEFFRDGCRFVHGWFSEVIESLHVDPDNSVGIANMSLLYYTSDRDECAIFDRTFRRKFVL